MLGIWLNWLGRAPRQKKMVCPQKWTPFLGPKFRFLVQKSDFCHTTPILVDDPFLALGMTVNFPPWERFFDFPFQSYCSFRKKIRLTAQKVFPPPTVGHRLPVTALALSARGLDKNFERNQYSWCLYQSSQNNIQLKTFQGIVKNVPCHSLSVVFVAMLTPLSFAGKEWLKNGNF